MSLQSILDDIDEKKKNSIDSLKKEYDTKKGELIISSEKKVSDIRAAYDRKTTDATSIMRARELSIIDLEEKRIILERRNQLVEEALRESEEALGTLTKTKEYKDILSTMLSTAKRMLGDRASFFLFKEDLKENGDQTKAKELTRNCRVPGGVVATSSDGKMEVDLTFDTIFREIREDLALELIKRIKEN